MEGRKRFLFLAGALFFALILLSFGKGQAHEHEGDCYVFSASWTCLEQSPPDLNPSNWATVFVSRHKDHRVIMGGFVWGEWYEWGKNSLLIMFRGSGCDPAYSGTKKQGFATCLDGSRAGKPPACWTWKKVGKSSKTCWWLVEGGSSSGAEELEEAAEEMISGGERDE